MDKIIFKPRGSFLGWFLPVCVIGFLIFLVYLKYPKLFVEPSLMIKHSLFIIPFSLFFIFELVIFFTMHYELRSDAIYLKGGPFSYKIYYSDIKQINKTDLTFHPIASNRWPGYAFGECYYADAGTVMMCATSMCKNIILIQTTSKLYGVTPKDEIAFIEKLKKKTEEVDEC
ncbi:MAG: PH domain-containing protein [bacterium]